MGWQALSREEFERQLVPAMNAVALRHHQPAMSKEEIDQLYERYVRGRGSLLAPHDRVEFEKGQLELF